MISTPAEAARYGMHGSPTILIDGHDPFAVPGTPASLSCRLYRDADGRAQGAPSAEQLREVLAARCCPSPAPAAVAAGGAGRGRLAPTGGGLRAVQQAVLRSFAATGQAPDPAVLEDAAPQGVPADSVLGELAAADTSPGDVIAFDLHTWHASAGGRDRLAWTAVYQRCPETAAERDRALRSVRDSFEQAFRGFDRDRYPVWRDWPAARARIPAAPRHREDAASRSAGPVRRAGGLVTGRGRLPAVAVAG